MNEDLVVRLVVVAAVAVVTVATAMILRSGCTWTRRPVTVRGFGPGTYFFSSATCSTCAALRAVLAGHPEVIEVAFEEAGDRFPDEVDRVPAIAHLDATGKGWIAHGVVSHRRLARWLGNP
jgi:hypothetical protein